MQHSVQAGQALLVHYQALEWRSYFPALDELGKLGYQNVLEGNGVQILSFPVDEPVKPPVGANAANSNDANSNDAKVQ
jgi:hypothetical protein